MCEISERFPRAEEIDLKPGLLGSCRPLPLTSPRSTMVSHPYGARDSHVVIGDLGS